MLGKRFRIVGLLGAGGMGEVYRADDLELGQSVALKFLPSRLTGDEAAMARFRNEVRMARHVAHPNLCRVFDIGEIDGLCFLSMEYVDGEDLASVLRRMGRPSKEKALQIARQLCAGLAAAHENGVLHRDLKPANVMIDGRGRVRITDFGLAGFTADFGGQDVRCGTPAYMAPEQLAGKEVTVRSDIYALGLLLYEVFTGQRAYEANTIAEMTRLRQESPIRTPSSHIAEIDPAVERVMLQCLETEPRFRPATVMAVAGALPGGDPLAAALAAGETPSPELLAASGEVGALRPAVALTMLVVSILGMALYAKLNDFVALYRLAPFDKPPAVLADRAAEIVKKLGYSDPVVDRAWSFGVDTEQLAFMAQNDHSANRWRQLASNHPAPIQFWYRQSPVPLRPWGSADRVSAADPPLLVSGMARLWMDARGMLVAFHYQPSQVEAEAPTTESVDWSMLFQEAGLEESAFEPTEPKWTPMMFADQRRAWTGSFPARPDVPVRVEAASFGGRPVSFVVVRPYIRPGRMPTTDRRSFWRIAADWIQIIIKLTALVGSAVIARRHWRFGRGDPRGAFKVAGLVAAIGMVSWLLEAHHVSGGQEFELFIQAAGRTLFTSAWWWLMYMALEPYARRHWPETLIAWSRLLSGRLRDPLVGRAVLVGFTAAVGLALFEQAMWLLCIGFGSAPPDPLGVSAVTHSAQSRLALAVFIGDLEFLFAPILGLFIIVLVQMVVRRRMLALVLVMFFCAFLPSLLVSLPGVQGFTSVAVFSGVLAMFGVGAVLLVRLGLPALMAVIFVSDRLAKLPVTLDTTAWYSGISIFVLVGLAAVAIWAYQSSLGGRSLWSEEQRG